jgi:hypothetical protein
VVKHWQALLIFEILKYTYVSPENFLTPPPPPPRRQHFREKFLRLGQNSIKCWSEHDETPPQC